MGRTRRQDFEGAWHHVMNRGASHQRVFFDASDGRAFLRLVGEGPELFGIQVHAYCLMTNHFHLLVRCPNGNLSEFMQRIGSIYTKRINAARGGDGSLFRSRFHSIVVDSDEYLSTVARYIHRNPLDIRPPVALDQYRWSSLGAYLGSLAQPDWLTTSSILEGYDKREEYAKYVFAESQNDAVSRWELEWIVSVLVDQTVDDSDTDRTGLTRAALLAAVDQSESLRTLVEFPNDAARRQALYRARKRLATTPSIEAVVAQVLARTA